MTVIQGKKHVNQEKGPPTPLELSHRILPTGEAAVEIAGELDLDTADQAFRYVQKIINRHRGPIVVSLAGVTFCDARGLRALVRMANHADQAEPPVPGDLAQPQAGQAHAHDRPGWQVPGRWVDRAVAATQPGYLVGWKAISTQFPCSRTHTASDLLFSTRTWPPI